MTAVVAAVLAGGLVGAPVALVLRARDRDRSAAVRARLAERPGRGAVPGWFGRLAEAVELGGDVGRAWAVARFLGPGVALGALATRPALTGLALAAVVVGVVLVAPAMARRRAAAAFEAGLPAVVEAIAGRLGAGSSLLQAFAAAAEEAPPPLDEDLHALGTRQARGSSLQRAIDEWGRSRPGTGVALVADALALAGASGGSQARALVGVAATLRERQALRREVRALGAQARASATVLVVLPVAFSAVVALVDPRVGHVLVATPVGWGCLVAGVALDGIGAWWMARLLGAAS